MDDCIILRLIKLYAPMEINTIMQEIIINFEPVELYKILKFEGLAERGAQAKQIIADGLVKVNGEIETRKRRKMLNGDNINLAGQEFVLKLA